MHALSKRMKENYELRFRHKLLRRMPVIIRVDGRAFHTLTKGMDKPFDRHLMCLMQDSARLTAEQIQGFKVAYIQSDEASFLLTDYDSLETDAWFGYVQNKLESITASLMTANFNRFSDNKIATFDARAFNIPREEVTNYFLWRALDWKRNSLTMYAQSVFSHKELLGKNQAAMHEMLHERGLNWATDLTEAEKNGTFILADCTYLHHIKPTYLEIDQFVNPVVNCDE